MTSTAIIISVLVLCILGVLLLWGLICAIFSEHPQVAASIILLILLMLVGTALFSIAPVHMSKILCLR